jgi:uncharacterized membrane protein YhaH (DUF805 family)
MDIQTAVRTVFSKYATFSGRARRAELWWFVLFNIIVSVVLGVLDSALFGFGEGQAQVLGPIWSLAVLLPSLAVGARRPHDIGRSGWWQLISLIPIIGLLVLIWWYAQPGEPGTNQYGENPLSAMAMQPSSVPNVPRG